MNSLLSGGLLRRLDDAMTHDENVRTSYPIFLYKIVSGIGYYIYVSRLIVHRESGFMNYFKKPESGKDFAECKIWKRSVKYKGGNVKLYPASSKSASIHTCNDGSIRTKVNTANNSGLVSSSSSKTEVIQPTVKNLFASDTLLTPGDNRHKSIADTITYFLCKDNVSFNTVSGPGFQELLKVLEPRYKIPDQTTFSDTKSLSSMMQREKRLC